MTRAEDIAYAVDLGVDAIGLIFYAKSNRFISIEKAAELLKDLPPFIDAVAVMVNPSMEFVQRIVDELPVQFLQFHGDESAQFCQQFNMPFIKAVHPDSAQTIHQKTQEFAGACALLLDTPSDTERGGTGLTFDWKIIPDNAAMPYILAGGLNEFNVREAVSVSHPFAVDVCSGIEAEPGIKDPEKMKRFVTVLWDN